MNNILTQLCYYDKRNPDCSADEEEIQDHEKMILNFGSCMCDNCFNGRTPIANSNLIMLEALKEITEGKGRYNPDGYTHARNTIEDMIELAEIAIKNVDK